MTDEWSALTGNRQVCFSKPEKDIQVFPQETIPNKDLKGTHVKVNLPLRTNTWGEDERAKPVFTYANHSSAGMEVEVKRRGNIPVDDEPYFKRARACPAFTRPQLRWEQDKMED